MARRMNGNTYRRSPDSNKDVIRRTWRNGKVVREDTIRKNQMPKGAKEGANK